MAITWNQAWEILVLTGLLYISNKFMRPLGAFLHSLLSMILRVPLIGRLFSYIWQHPFYLNAIAKPIAWVISSSGILTGILIHDFFWGSLNNPLEYWVVLLFAIFRLLEAINSLITLDAEFYYIDQLLKSTLMPSMPKSLLRQMGYQKEDFFIRLARTTFVDQAIVEFFNIIITIGISYYSLSLLKLIELQAGKLQPSIWESLLISFSLPGITDGIDIPFTGIAWQIIRPISTFITFFWLAMFITLTSSTLDDAAKRSKEIANELNQKWLEEVFKDIEEESDDYVQIIRAVVNPKDSIDSGHESITLYNFGKTPVTIQGWKIEDSDNNKYSIPKATIPPSHECLISIPPKTIYLRNNGGEIKILDTNENVIHKVSYTSSEINDSGIVEWKNADK